MIANSISGAEFSDCRVYRYSLWRSWGFGKSLMVIGLNPSTADEVKNDPTVRRCIRFAQDWGFAGLIMMNAFGLRSTDPKGLKLVDDPNGPGNDEALLKYSKEAGLILAAWGTHCPLEREHQICELLNTKIHCLGKTKAGRPKHPLYIRADTKPQIFYQP